MSARVPHAIEDHYKSSGVAGISSVHRVFLREACVVDWPYEWFIPVSGVVQHPGVSDGVQPFAGEDVGIAGQLACLGADRSG